MRLTTEPFTAIKEGRKVIESRLYDEKRSLIAPGDLIVFTLVDHPEEQITCEVTELLRYDNFEMLFSSHEPELFGGTDRQELLASIGKYYSEEDEARHGVVGIRLKRVA